MHSLLDLTDRVALVTGASSGIGAATAETLAELGARVAIGYHRNAQGAESTRKRIADAGRTVVAIQADVRHGEEVKRLVDRTVSDLGPVDIINVVSIAGHTGGGPGAGPYASAKAALTAYTKSLAKELAPHGVRVNAVSPGVIDTPFHEVFSTPDMIRSFVATIPVGRVGTSQECANVIAFLASDAASYIVGETIEVNGGQLMR